jgi:hypothetical protein
MAERTANFIENFRVFLNVLSAGPLTRQAMFISRFCAENCRLVNYYQVYGICVSPQMNKSTFYILFFDFRSPLAINVT